METLKQEPREAVGSPSLEILQSRLDCPQQPHLSCIGFGCGDRADQKTSRDPSQSMLVCDSVSHKIPYTRGRKKAQQITVIWPHTGKGSVKVFVGDFLLNTSCYSKLCYFKLRFRSLVLHVQKKRKWTSFVSEFPVEVYLREQKSPKQIINPNPLLAFLKWI